jgi:hypothetical protein
VGKQGDIEEPDLLIGALDVDTADGSFIVQGDVVVRPGKMLAIMLQLGTDVLYAIYGKTTADRLQFT